MEIKNKKVFLRTDFNVPIKDRVIIDDYRIVSTLKTLNLLKEQDAKTIIVSHIETEGVGKSTLKPVYDYIKNNHPEYDIQFMDNTDDLEEIKNKFELINPGGFLLLENIRNMKGEKDDDVELAKFFRSITDVYINDAFAVSHRKHMSVSFLPSLYYSNQKMFGLQMQKEIDALSKALNPEKPLAVILSGAKFSTKLPLIEKYLKTSDDLFVGGALYNNILKSLGNNIGMSLIDNNTSYIDTMVKTDDFINKVFIPKKVIVKNTDTDEMSVRGIDKIGSKETVQDIDNESIREFIEILKNKNTKTIVWNGPLGNYEDDRFKEGTLFLANNLVDYVKSNPDTHLFIGGGDTVAAINSLNVNDERIFVSTGGGAMLEFLEKDGRLPGVVSVLS